MTTNAIHLRTCTEHGQATDSHARKWKRLARSLLALGLARILLPLVLACGTFPALAQSQGGPAPASREIVFDIPSQDLPAALSAYAVKSGTQVLYEASLAAGRTSMAIEGKFTPEAALQALLAGTGLVGRRTDVDAITITPEPRLAKLPTVAPDARFLGVLQGGILDALCQNAETRPGDYRMALQLWITTVGALQRVSLLSSTGDRRRDSALIEKLRGLSIRALPPPGLTQPITLVIEPRSPLQGPECGGR
ncbi:secretin and TonB N-terminal domain-containing protein [Bradyrhizobium sp. USDA 10063]